MLHMWHRLTLLIPWVFIWFAHSAHSAPSIVNRPAAVCTYLARAANNDALARIALVGSPANGSAFPVPEELADRELAFKDLLDINNDGQREYVYVVQYPLAHKKGSSIIVDGSRILGEFGIPENHFVRQELFLYDQSMQKIAIGRGEEITKALADDPDRYRFVLHKNSYYVVAQSGEDLRYVLKLDSSNIAQPICSFEQRGDGLRMRTHALTTYEWLKQSLANIDGPEGLIWAYALSRDDFAVAELIIANGHSVNEEMQDESLVLWAINEERIDALDWLLKQGADPNVASEIGYTPLQEAIRDARPDMALTLMQHGADPAPAIYEISRLQRAAPEHKRSLILAAIKHLNYIPEQFLSYALREDPGLLDGLVKSGEPVRPYGVSFHAGERMKLPFDIDRFVQRKATDRQKAAIAQLFKRETSPPDDNFAIVHYGSYTQGVQIVRYGGSEVTDEHFFSFTTALCYYFMPYDCGGEKLISRAHAWVGTLKDECPSSLQSVLDERACRLAAHYRDIGNEKVHAFSSSEKGAVVEWQEFLNAYRAKHGQL